MKVYISNMEIIKKTSFDRLYALQVAAIVAREGTFVKAAKALGTSPSNITKEIQKIETYLGVQLFKRTTRSFVLTEDGLLTLEKSKGILDGLSDLEEELNNNTDSLKGLIRITAPTMLGQYLLAPIIAEFQVENPYIEIDLIFTDRILDPIEHNIDISIRTAFQLKDSNLFVKKINKLDRVICGSPKYLSRFKRPKNLDALAQHNCLLYLRGDSPFVWNFQKNGKTNNVHVQGNYKSNNLMSLITACEKGVGLLNIPKYLVQEQLDSDLLQTLFKSWQLPAHNIFLLSSRRPSSSRKLTALLEHLSKELR